MKTIRRFIILFFISGFLLNESVLITAKDQYVLKFATIAPEGSTWMNTMEEMNQEIQKLSEGRLKIRFYPGAIMGDELDVLRKMRINQLHGGGFSGVGMGEIVPDVRVLDLPFIFADSKEVEFVLSKMYDRFATDFRTKGYELMGWAEVGFVRVFSRRPVKSFEDLRKVKMWVWQDDPVASSIFKGMGISTVPLAIPDVMTSLQVGIIDTFYSPPLGAIALQWYTKVQYMMSFPITHSTGSVLISKNYYDKLPPDLQKILRDQFAKYLKILNDRTAKDNEDAVETLKKSKIEIVTPSQESLKEFVSVSEKARTDLAGKIYSAQALEELNSLIKSKTGADSGSK